MASTLISVTDIDYISGSHASTGQRASCQCSSTVTAQAQALDCYQPLDPTKLTPDDHITFGPRRSSDDEIFIEDLGGLNSKPLSGFLYYYQPPRAPPLAGEIRFRLTPSNDPGSFASGTDFTTKSGATPWSIPLLAIAGTKKNIAIHPGVAFPYALNFCKHIAQTRIQKITTFQYGSVMCNVPFLGSVVCCFEPSTLKEHSGTRVAVIRVLRSLKSDPIRPNPSYTGPPLSPQLCPQEGQLLMTPYRRKLQPWAGHVDAKSTPKRVNRTAALAVLFDNALVYGSTA
ncbi:hypothetical protein L226DRAFT_576500 [Lentinus tigrinus ALCF2SS1-7]|uniref:uncharacterized protein n=1 Tax=Lentinus tigrinus ALCF2SS1-7 TaxID=1328758 RepID=UPI0011661761|nr:hypothetical protein L226DRAFT_576500 [Lentinus tigrinus ALCF2SS1-7]